MSRWILNRWIAAPAVASLLMAGSGFLSALERTTELSAALAETSEEAPIETAAAAQRVDVLPIAARLTEQQAVAFKALVDALEISARRVVALNETLDQQVRDISRLAADIGRLAPQTRCVSDRIRELLDASGPIPSELDSITVAIGQLSSAQKKSIRHLKSINRKLTALGLVAEATDVRPPRGPRPVEAPSATGEAGRTPC